MTRRPQVLRVTDSATTGSRRQQVSQAVTPPQITSPEDESPRSSPHRSPSDSPQASPRSSGSPLPSSPGSDQQQTYVSQSSVTLRGLRGVPVYDEYLCADHRWVRSTDGKGRRRHSESEEDLGGGSAGGTSSSSGGSNSSCGSSYVTWTKSSLSSKQWQLMRSTSTPASAATQPAASRILKEDGGELMEGGGEEGCVAVLAPCPTTPTTPAVGLVTLAAKATKPPRDPQSRKPEQKRHQRHHSEFDGLLQYLQDYRHGLRELLVNNNVVIIEPVRASMRHGDDRRAHSAPVDDHHNDDKTCRITGAIVKSMSASETDGVPGVRVTSSNNTLPRSQKPHQPILRRQFFYHPIKINKELVDAELPDPDTVRNARKVFERAQRAQRAAPKTSLGLSGLTGLSHSHSGLDKRTCWTDSGSLSSGVSSDLSCCDLSTSCDTDLRTGTCSSGSQLSQREVFSSGDESEPDQPHQHTTTQVQMRAVETAVPGGGSDGNPVSEDVLQKIRACGTTVTYFGGEVISCSGAGPARSPMTMAIMEEIRRSARPLVGIKFRLVKSNSCGSRLELAGQTGGARWKRTAPAATPDLFQTPAATPDTFKPPAATPDTFRAPAATPDLFKAPAEDSPRTRRVSAECVAEREEEVVVIETKDTVRDEEPRDAKVDGDVQNGDTRGDNAPKAPNAVDTRNTRTKEVVKEVINDKENRPALGPASWRLSGKSKRAVAALPLPRPQQPDKFGVMEFEEFQFIET